MSHDQYENLENIKRMAERGREAAFMDCPSYVDYFQHIIDLVEWIKVSDEPS